MPEHPDDGGCYCARCGAAIYLTYQQTKFGALVTADRPGCDPYVSVSRFGFGIAKSYSSNLHYCFDCEPLLFEVLKKFNEEIDAKLQRDPRL